MADIIGSHPDFIQHGEILLPESKKPQSFTRFKRRSRSTDPAGIWSEYLSYIQGPEVGARHIGFLVKYQDVSRIENLDITTHRLFASVRIIHLVRRDLLRSIASQHLARAREVYVTTRERQYAVNSVHLSPKGLLHALNQKRNLVSTFRTALANRPNSLELVYEDLLHGERVSDTISRQLATFFQVEDKFKRQPDTVQLAPEHLSDLISNYDEVARFLSEQRCQHVLDH